jgi:hypothetical protein
MTKRDDDDLGGDQRHSPRAKLATSVRIELTGTHVDGTTRNVSKSGLLLVTEESLSALVEYVDGDHHVARRGRIVRVQRLAGDALGIAISFDEDE